VQIYIKKTLKNINNYTELGGCRLSTGGGGVITLPRGGGGKISLVICDYCDNEKGEAED